MELLIAVDIGGTKVRIGAFSAANLEEVIKVKDYASGSYPGLTPILQDYLKQFPDKPKAIAIGIAGPVEGRRVTVTNLPWSVDAAEVATICSDADVFLLNDLEAHAWGVGLLRPNAGLICLHPGVTRVGNRALIAAGTGLGEANLFWDGQRHIPSASEGGHTSFAPTTNDDVELLQYLWKQSAAHVSWERIVSGSFGLPSIYQFWQNKLRGASLRTAEEVFAAAADGDATGVAAMRMFARLYGAEAGNLALKSMAVGGIYLGGGIAPKILSWLKGPDFMVGFTSKGRFQELLEKIPIHIIDDPYNALRGAARCAVSKISR